MRSPHPNARALRQNMPEAERLLWHYLCRKQLGGFRFRRQHTIDRYIVDFVCVEAKLVVELDGAQHGKEDANLRDTVRDAFLQEQGYEVLRFWNREVFTNMDGVLNTILDAAMNSVRYLANMRPEESK
jgi:very-short-patch-repair endonuclease